MRTVPNVTRGTVYAASAAVCFGMTPRIRRFVLGFVIAVAVLGAMLYALTRIYVEYQAHQAISLLAKSARLQIGDSESSVLPLVERYSGFKWMPEPLSPKEDWIEKDEYVYQRNLLSDYKYELGVSPFGTVTGHLGRLTKRVRAVRKFFPSCLQVVLGMRDWGTVVELSIRQGRVQSVLAMTLVEGRTEWLGDKWELRDGMPHHDMKPRTYVIGTSFLEMEDGGGMMIENVVTPRASVEQVQAARNFNASCLTSIRGCTGVCDLAPRALQYLKQHPEATWNITPPKCP